MGMMTLVRIVPDDLYEKILALKNQAGDRKPAAVTVGHELEHR
jgi:hypothetical protein